MFEDSSSTPEWDCANVSSFTVSTSFDTHRAGTKHTHFVSMNFDLVSTGSGLPRTQEEVSVMLTKASLLVSKECVKQALTRGQITVDEANDRIQDVETNHSALLEKGRARMVDAYERQVLQQLGMKRLDVERAADLLDKVRRPSESVDEFVQKGKEELEKYLSKRS